MQVRLPRRKTRRTPDLFFVSRSRLQIIKYDYVDGPPNLIMEIVSSDSKSRDWREKYFDYEKSGVQEYWIIDPYAERVEAYYLRRDRKYHRITEVDGQVRSRVIRRFQFRPAWLWKSPLTKVATVLKELGIRF